MYAMLVGVRIISNCILIKWRCREQVILFSNLAYGNSEECYISRTFKTSKLHQSSSFVGLGTTCLMSFFSVVGMLLALYIDSHVNFRSAKYLWFNSSCKITSLCTVMMMMMINKTLMLFCYSPLSILRNLKFGLYRVLFC